MWGSASRPSKTTLAKYGTLEIFNTDQGSQFTCAAFTGLLMSHGIRISMDGKGCWLGAPGRRMWCTSSPVEST